MIIENLIVEVTRKCNLKCKHCLRGKAENINIDFTYIDKLLEDVTDIYNITFTGGEPSLHTKAIKYFLEKAKEKKIGISSFYIVSNGKIYSKELVLVMMDFYAYCYEKENCGFAISKDDYHDIVKDEIIDKYSGLVFFEKRKTANNIISEGNAFDNGIGTIMIDEEEINLKYIVDSYEDELSVEGLLYLSATGLIVPHCDLSYENQKNYAIGNLNKKSLIEILVDYFDFDEDTKRKYR